MHRPLYIMINHTSRPSQPDVDFVTTGTNSALCHPAIPNREHWEHEKEENINQLTLRVAQLVAVWQPGREKMEREWGNGERFILYIFSLFPLSLSIFYIKNCLILSQNVKYCTFVSQKERARMSQSEPECARVSQRESQREPERVRESQSESERARVSMPYTKFKNWGSFVAKC